MIGQRERQSWPGEGGGERRRLMNRGQTAVRTHISRATGVLKQPGETVTLYQQETERGNEMVSRSRFLYLCLCVRTWVLWFHECRQGRKKKKKNRSPGTFLVLNIPRPSSEARNYKNNTYIDTVVKLWVTRLYLELWLVFGDILEPQKDQINSAR